MNLKNFENFIEEKIVARGLSYYKNDCIEDVEQVEENEFCGVALGTDEYTVTIQLDSSKNIVRHDCDCPYDWGNFCKHEAAMLYYLRKEGLPKRSKEGKIAMIKNDLEQLNKAELIETIVGLCKRNKTVKDEIYWSLGYEQ